MKKQTKLWTTKDGRRIRICDMSDDHLDNTIKLLDRMAKAAESQTIVKGFKMLNILHGEMAIDSVEREIDRVMEYGIDPCEISPLYENLTMEQLRRS